MTEKTAIVQLLPQEQTGSCLFNGSIVMTANFERTFDGNVFFIVLESLAKIHERALEDGADYFQVLAFNGIKYWVIDDLSVVTFLMPADY